MYNHLFLSLHFSYLISHFTHVHIHITYHILMSYSILVIYPCLYMFHTYNLQAYAIYTILTLICIRSHICSFILRFSYIFLYFYRACIYSFLYSSMPIICVHVLIPGNIFYLVNFYIFMYFIRLSYLMTYTNTFLYLYVLLVLYQTVLAPIGVTELIPIRRYLYTYLYFYLSYIMHDIL